jgi:hypothetical protein
MIEVKNSRSRVRESQEAICMHTDCTSQETVVEKEQLAGDIYGRRGSGS